LAGNVTSQAAVYSSNRPIDSCVVASQLLLVKLSAAQFVR